MPDYGLDISCITDIDPSLRLVSGNELMREVIVRRLTCRKGSLLSDPLYGIDIRDFLNSRIDSKALTRIQSLVTGELQNDERILSVTSVASFNTTSKALTIQMQGKGASGPFNLTITAGAGALSVSSVF
jgi:phage baseplate assembly protein W